MTAQVSLESRGLRLHPRVPTAKLWGTFPVVLRLLDPAGRHVQCPRHEWTVRNWKTPQEEKSWQSPGQFHRYLPLSNTAATALNLHRIRTSAVGGQDIKDFSSGAQYLMEEQLDRWCHQTYGPVRPPGPEHHRRFGTTSMPGSRPLDVASTLQA